MISNDPFYWKSPECRDAQEMAIKHPNTFEAPDMKDLESLHSGDIVKISVGEERFWVKVSEVDGNIVKGKVDNDLIFSHAHGLYYRDQVQFEKRHIYSVWE